MRLDGENVTKLLWMQAQGVKCHVSFRGTVCDGAKFKNSWESWFIFNLQKIKQSGTKYGAPK